MQDKDPREKTRQTTTGMRSDTEPQPKEDPDFGPGLEYESGDRDPDFTEAEKIRQRWTEDSKDKPKQKREPEAA